MPEIQRATSVPFELIHWMVLAYLLALSASLFPAVYVSEVLGRSRAFTLGLAVFLASGYLCALAQPYWAILCFRIGQGIGAAFVITTSFALVGELYGRSEHARPVALLVMGRQIAACIAPPLGGLLVSMASWRYMLFASVSAGLIGLAAARALPSTKPSRRSLPARELWLVLVGGSSVGMIALYLGLAPRVGWTATSSLSALVAGSLCAALFVTSTRGRPSLVADPRLLRSARTLTVLWSGFIAELCAAAAIFLVPFFLVGQASVSNAELGGIMAFFPCTAAVGTVVTGRLVLRLPMHIVCGIALFLLSLGALGLCTLDGDSVVEELLLWGMIVAFGIGLFRAPNLNLFVGELPRTHATYAVSLTRLARQVGMLLGVGLGAAAAATVAPERLGSCFVLVFGPVGLLLAASTATLFIAVRSRAEALAG